MRIHLKNLSTKHKRGPTSCLEISKQGDTRYLLGFLWFWWNVLLRKRDGEGILSTACTADHMNTLYYFVIANFSMDFHFILSENKLNK